jgi:hypothetical protein
LKLEAPMMITERSKRVHAAKKMSDDAKFILGFG